jgi:hypothetical protein
MQEWEIRATVTIGHVSNTVYTVMLAPADSDLANTASRAMEVGAALWTEFDITRLTRVS